MRNAIRNSDLFTARISGIVLAAGQSSRIGETKQLLKFRGSTLLGQVIANARESLLDEIIVVLGHAEKEIQNKVNLEGVKVVLNENYRQGQGSSLKAGLHHVSKESHAAMFLLGDQPLIDKRLINSIIKVFKESSKPILIPVFEGKRGNPVVVGRELFGELTENVLGDAGARVLFNRHAGLIQYMEMDNCFIHVDVDSMEDYKSLINMMNESH